MKYLTGILCFQIPCELDSVGSWNLSKRDFLNDELFDVRESDETKLRKYGIEENKIVPFRSDDGTLYNVANHVRSYLDMLYDKKHEELTGLFYDYIKTLKCRDEIFKRVYHGFKRGDLTNEAYQFMEREFGSNWFSYVQSYQSAEAAVGSEGVNVLS